MQRSRRDWTPQVASGKLRAVKQCIVTLDMEGVLTPEIWIAVAEDRHPELPHHARRTGLRQAHALSHRILDQHSIKLTDIQNVIGTLPAARWEGISR
jgi:hypothetical protein